MAVVSCKEIVGDGCTLEFSQARSYNRRFRIKTDNDLDGPLTVSMHHELPAGGSVYVEASGAVDPNAFLRSIRPNRSADDPRVWIVDCAYTNTDARTGAPGSLDQGGAGSGEPGQGASPPTERPENPLDRPTVWAMDFVKEMESVEVDLDAKPVANSLGVLYSPAHQIPKPFCQITATKNYASFTYDQALAYFGKISSDVWHGIGAKKPRIDGVSLRGLYENGVSFVQATWTFLVNPDGWNPTKLLDQGAFYKTVLGIQLPFNLDGRGLGGGLGMLDGDGHLSEVPVFNDFRFHNQIPFSTDPMIP